MTYMKKVAEMLGVEIGEEFGIENQNDTYEFREDGLFIVSGESMKHYDESFLSDNMLCDLLMGEFRIKMKAFKPEYNKIYFYVDIKGEIEFTRCGRDLYLDSLNWKIGNCFKTRDINKETIDRFVKFLNDANATFKNI